MVHKSTMLSSGGGGGVTTIDGISGAVSLVAGTNITISDNTPGAGQITLNAIGTSGYVYNPTNNKLPKFNTAITRVKANGGNATVLWIGTSTVAGANSGGNNLWSQTYTLEQQLATILTNAYGIPANADGIFGYNADTSSKDANPNLSVGAGWATPDSVVSIGGPMFVNTTDTTAVSFTLPTTADRVTLYYPTDNSGSPTLGTFSYQVNSGSVTNVNQGTSAPAVASVTITLTPGANVLKVARVSGTTKIIGVLPYLSTKSTVNIINSGYGGATAGSWNSGSGKAYSTNTAWASVSPDLALIQMDNNDAVAGTATTTYKTNMTSIINGCSNGDTILIAQEPYGAAGGTVANLPAYITAQQQLAVASSVPFIDQTLRVPSYDNFLTPNGLSNQDGLHCNTGGYIDQGQFLASEIMTIAGVQPLYTQYMSQYVNGNLGNGVYGMFAGGSQVANITSSQWLIGQFPLPAFPQGTLDVVGSNYTNGTAKGGILSLDKTTGGAAGVGGGFIAQFDDGTATPRAGAGFFTRKYDSTVGNSGGDAVITARANGAASTDVLKLSAQDAMSTFSTGLTVNTGNVVFGATPTTAGAFKCSPSGGWAGIYDTGNSLYYGISQSLPSPSGTSTLGGYYKGLGVGGSTNNTATPIFGVLTSTQSGQGVGNTNFGVTDSKVVTTYNNTLDNGSGGATFASHVTIEGVTSTGATGTGNLVFATSPTITTPKVNQLNDTNGATALTLAATTSAVNYVTITNASSGTYPTIAAGGAGNLNLVIQGKGIGSVQLGSAGNGNSLIASAATSSVNYFIISGRATTVAPTITAAGSDTDIGINLVPKGAGTIQSSGVFMPVQATTAGAPTYIKGGMYFDTTLNKLRIGGASGWETVTSV